MAGLLARAFLGGTQAASEGIYEQHQLDMKAKRDAAYEKIRQDFTTGQVESQRTYETGRDETRYKRERTDAESDYSRNRTDQLADTEGQRAHELKLAGMKAKSGSTSNKLNPLISEQIKGIDNELEGYYKAQAEGMLQPDQHQRMQWLQQQRTFMLGGGLAMPSSGPAAGPASDPSDAGGSGGQIAEETEKPEGPKGPGLLQRGMDWYKNIAASGTQAPPTGELVMKTDAMMKAIDRGEAIDPQLARDVYPYLADTYRAKIDAPR
jgi:hypothetical protein